MGQPMSPRRANANVIAGLKCAEMSPRNRIATISHSAENADRISATAYGDGWPPPYLTIIAAPPDRMNVRPNIPMNSAISRSLRCWFDVHDA